MGQQSSFSEQAATRIGAPALPCPLGCALGEVKQVGQSAAQRASTAPTEVLAGLVERVTYHNAENGFCVLRVKARGHKDLVTVVGHAASIAAGEWVQLSGT